MRGLGLTSSQCYLCPGNSRAAGDKNPVYEKTFAFVNDYSAVKEQQPDYEARSASADGTPLDSTMWLTLLTSHPQMSSLCSSAPRPSRASATS